MTILNKVKYCPLIWMFHSRTINNKINLLHERALRIVYSDFKSSFEGLLMKDNWEIYKFLNGLFCSFLNNFFHKNISNSHDIRNHKKLYSRNPKIARYRIETVLCMVPKIWIKVPETIKMSSSLKSFKTKIR